MVQHLVCDEGAEKLLGVDAGEQGHHVAMERAFTQGQSVGTVPPVREPAHHMLVCGCSEEGGGRNEWWAKEWLPGMGWCVHIRE